MPDWSRKPTQEKFMRLVHQDRLTRREAQWLIDFISPDQQPNSGNGLPLKLAFDAQNAIFRHLFRVCYEQPNQR